MSLSKFSVSLALFLSAIPCSAKQEREGAVNQSERSQRIEALEAAYKAMDKAHLSDDGKVVFIKYSGNLIVVSFLNPQQGKVYGGQTHVTYDPKKKAVVDVLNED